MSILVVGAGAVGGYFGGRLVEAGQDVAFLVRPARAQTLRATGLKIRSSRGDAVVRPQIVLADELSRPFDVVLLSVKGYALQAAMDDFAPAVGPDTLILPALNGIKHLDALEARFGAGPVLGGVCMIVAQLDDDGAVAESGAFQTLRYGERDGALSDRIRSLDSALQAGAFDAAVSTQILQDMWEKWTMLACTGAITCLLGGAVGAVAEVDGGAETALAILGETCAVAAAWGHPPGEAFLARTRQAVTRVGSALTTSMYRDMIAGHPVEVDQILGDLVRRGREKRVSTPLLTAAKVKLEVYQRARAAML